jgi:hypothetical protein
MGLHRLAVLAALVLALMALPAGAAATTTYLDTISGSEIYATSTEGTFVGSASGALPGSWEATIDHTPLSPNATITGGSFYLATTINSIPVAVSGDFTGGTVMRLNPDATRCVNQYLSINAYLSNVGIGFSGSGTGTFTGTLVHHRVLVFGYCVIYSATVTGSLSLSF